MQNGNEWLTQAQIWHQSAQLSFSFKGKGAVVGYKAEFVIGTIMGGKSHCHTGLLIGSLDESKADYYIYFH